MAYVEECPKTQKDLKIDSKRLGCGNDTFGNNQYMCIPNKEKTHLVEFCYNEIMGIQEKGNCLEASPGTVTQYNCTGFTSGCPNTSFFKYEVYRYPACQNINPQYRCFVSDPLCPSKEQSQESSISHSALITCSILGGLFLLFLIGAVLLYIKKRRSKQAQEGTNDPEEKEGLMEKRKDATNENLADTENATNENLADTERGADEKYSTDPKGGADEKYSTDPKGGADEKYSTDPKDATNENLADTEIKGKTDEDKIEEQKGADENNIVHKEQQTDEDKIKDKECFSNGSEPGHLVKFKAGDGCDLTIGPTIGIKTARVSYSSVIYSRNENKTERRLSINIENGKIEHKKIEKSMEKDEQESTEY